MKVMTQAETFNRIDADESLTLETCDSMILCLQNGRFVVVHPDAPRDLWPCDGGWEKVRDLKPGDQVVYKGDILAVRAVEVYR